jgi:3-oxoacyl-[acyl-carrier-protein] synthase-3
VSAEIASRALPWEDDPATAGLFGDGAAAVVISAGNGETGLVATCMETHASGYEACALASGGTRFDYHQDRTGFDAHSFFRMDGEALFRLTLKAFEPFLERLLHEAGWTRRDVDVVIPHQASPGALAHLAKRSGFEASRIINIVETHGNQIAASIPTALHMGRISGQVGKGQNLLLIGTSAGVSLGGMAVRT